MRWGTVDRSFLNDKLLDSDTQLVINTKYRDNNMTAWVKEIREEELAPVDLVPQGFWKRYVASESGGRGMVFGMGKLMPGEEVSHGHIEEELFYVLSGSGEAAWEIDGTTHNAELKPGVAFYKTSNIEHTMCNTGQEPLIGLYFKV